MKKLIRMLTLGLMGLALSVSALAQQPAASPSQDDVDKKAALYEKYTKNYQTNSDLAYAAAKEYVTTYPNDTDDIANYLKDYVGKYEKLKIKVDLVKSIEAKKWAEGWALGKQVLANEPNDLEANLNTAFAGMQLAMTGNNANNVEAAGISTKTIAMVVAATTLPNGKPYPENVRNEQLGWLNYSLYLYNLANKLPDAAAGNLIKAAQYENPFKNDPNTYLKLVAIYDAEYEKRRLDYATRFDGKEKSPEGDAAFEHVKQEADLVIDAIARAIAYSGTDPKTQLVRDELKKTLTDYYKFRHGSVDGIDALISGIKSKPIPQPGAAAPTPVTTSAPATADNTAASGTKTSATTPAPTTTPASSTTTTPSTTQTGTQEKKPETAPAGTNGRRPRNR